MKKHKKMKIKKKFEYEGIELQIVEREETYMNAVDTITMRRVLAPNGGVVPVEIQNKQTLKSIVETTINTLNNFKNNGIDVKAGLLQRMI